MSEERFDPMLLAIAQQQSNGIDGVLDVFFSFLRRKSDFFSGAGEGYDMVESTVIKALKRHYMLYEAECKKKGLKVVSSVSKKVDSDNVKSGVRPVNAVKAAGVNKIQVEDEVYDLSPSGKIDLTVSKVSDVPPTSSISPSDNVMSPPPESTRENNAIEEAIRLADGKVAPGSGNGYTTSTYSWTQSLSEITLSIPIPAKLKAKDLNVSIHVNKLLVGVKGEKPILDGVFYRNVVSSGCDWTIDSETSSSHKVILITLQKENTMEWWPFIVEGEPEIDLQKIDPENSKLTDLDPSTRSLVEKMMFDQKQKKLGLPTSDEISKQDALKRFMSAHPEMDFSGAKFM